MKSASTRSTPRRPFAGARVRDGSRSDRKAQLESKQLPARSDDNEVLEAVSELGLCARKGYSSTRGRLGPGEHLRRASQGTRRRFEFSPRKARTLTRLAWFASSSGKP